VNKSRKVIPLVQELKNRAEYLGFLVWKGDSFGGGIHVSISEGVGEEGAGAKDIFVSGEEALLGTDDEGNNRRGTSRC
jgi:hypothetical protein